MTTSLLTVFFISMAGAFFGQSVPSNKRNLWGKRKPNPLGLIIPCTVMVLFSGLRNNIGDTIYYVHTYKLIQNHEAAKAQWGDEAYLFSVFQETLVGNEATVGLFIMITAIVTLVPMLLLIYNYSFDYPLAVFFLFSTGLYTTSMNGVRQFMAAGIALLAAKYLFSSKKRDCVKFLIFILLASLIHSSALVMIPVYFLCRHKAWSAPTFVILGAGVVGLIFISQFMPSFLGMLEDTDYSDYTSGWFTDGVEAGTGIFRVAFNVLPMVLSIIFSKQLRQFGPVADILINLSVFNAAIFLLATYNWIFARFALYTYAYVVLLLSLIVSSMLKEGKNKWLFIVMILCYSVFFIKDAYSSGLQTYASDYFTPNNNKWLEVFR